MSAPEPVESTALERELLSVADEAAHAAATELMSRFGHSQEGIHTKSSPTDLVSDADVAAEGAIRAVLAARRPYDAILGEEGGATGDGDSIREHGIGYVAASCEGDFEWWDLQFPRHCVPPSGCVERVAIFFRAEILVICVRDAVHLDGNKKQDGDRAHDNAHSDRCHDNPHDVPPCKM